MSLGSKVPPRLTIALAMVSTLLGTALISPLYPVFQDQWGLGTGDISNVYVIYMFGALFGLIFLGRLGDRMGYVATLMVAQGLALVGSLLCLIADGMVLLSIGRFLVGIAGTMATAAGSAGLNLLSPGKARAKVALKISLLVSLGFGLGPIIGGVVGQWLPNPLVTVQIPTLVMLVVGIALLSTMVPKEGLGSAFRKLAISDFTPKLTWPKSPVAVTFGLATLLPFITFGVYGLYASMAPTIIRNVLGVGGPIISGLGIAGILTGSCLTQIAIKRLGYVRSALIGLTLVATSNALLLVNLQIAEASLFAVGMVITAMGHGACMFAGVQVVNMVSDHTNRASLTSSFWAVGYCGSIIPMIATGQMAELWGLNRAVSNFCISTIVLCTVVLILFAANEIANRKAGIRIGYSA